MSLKYPITLEGKKQLEEELRYLKTEKREEINQKIKNARIFCDFSEDVTFKEMIDERSLLEERIDSLEHTLFHADNVPEETADSVVHFGSTVTFKECPDAEEETYTIVGAADANPLQNKISYQSPTVQNLLGREEGDIISIATPAGNMEIQIITVK